MTRRGFFALLAGASCAGLPLAPSRAIGMDFGRIVSVTGAHAVVIDIAYRAPVIIENGAFVKFGEAA